ncbi:MAG: zf-HC2 domain-containing protein [Oscillospiraceae bacterium]|nr:zf-HC2 domain-containing protein [Oscillospiraceae bacterium]
MKCCIAKDLLPLYAEQLTGEETAAEIRAHLEQCEECAALFAEMQAQQQPAIAAPEDIRPLKTVRTRSRILALAAAAFSVLFYVLFFRFCIMGTKLRSDQITMEVKTNWVVYNPERLHHRLRRFDTYGEAAAAMQEPDAGRLYEEVHVTVHCDCLSVRADGESGNIRDDSDTPEQFRASTSHCTFYSVLMPPLALDSSMFHKSRWAQRSFCGVADEGSTVMICCRDGNFGYQLTDLAALADASPDGKATLAVGEKIPVGRADSRFPPEEVGEALPTV